MFENAAHTMRKEDEYFGGYEPTDVLEHLDARIPDHSLIVAMIHPKNKKPTFRRLSTLHGSRSRTVVVVKES